MVDTPNTPNTHTNKHDAVDTFHDFLKKKRNDRKIPIRAMANMVEFSAEFYCDVETGHRRPPDTEELDKLAGALQLSGCESKTLHVLAARVQNASSQENAEPSVEPQDLFTISKGTPTGTAVDVYSTISPTNLADFIQKNDLKHIVLRVNRRL